MKCLPIFQLYHDLSNFIKVENQESFNELTGVISSHGLELETYRAE
jgi:hypothetical protein